MSAGRYDLNIEQGATFQRVITVNDPTGALVDYSGKTLRAYIRETYSAAAALQVITVYLDGDLDIILLLTATETAALDSTCGGAGYVWDLEAEDNSGVVERILQGRVYVSPEATK